MFKNFKFHSFLEFLFQILGVFCFFFVFIHFELCVPLIKWPLKEVNSSKDDAEVNGKGTYLKKYSILCNRSFQQIFLNTLSKMQPN